MSCYNHDVKLCGLCDVALIPKYNLFALFGVSFPHIYDHIFVPSLRSSALHHFRELWWNAVTLLSVDIRRKSNAGLVALQECCPNVPALLLSPHHLHSFVQSLYWFIASLYPYFSSSSTSLSVFALIILPTDHYLLWLRFALLFIPALSLNPLIFSIHHLNLRTDHTLISLLSSLPPPTSLYPWSKFFHWLTKTNQCSLLNGCERHHMSDVFET